MRKGRLENWQEIQLFGRTMLCGNIFGCKDFPDGDEMITSEVVKYHNMMGQTVVETRSGSMYHLGAPADPERTLQEIANDAAKAGKPS